MDSTGEMFLERPAPPVDDDIALLEENLRLIDDRSDRVINYFYATLFLESPALRSLFPAAMDAQRDRLFRALIGAVRNLGDAGELRADARAARP